MPQPTMKYITTVILLLCLFSAFAQKKPSANPDSIKLRSLQKLVDQFKYKSPAKATAYAQQGLALAVKTNNKLAIGKFYGFLGDISSGQQKFAEAIAYYRRDLNLAREQYDSVRMINAYVGTGLVYQNQADFLSSMRSLFSALSISESMKKRPRSDLIYVNIASVFLNENNSAKAIEYINKALKMGNTGYIAKAKAYELYGVINQNTQKFPEAKSWFTKALKIYQHTKDSIGQATMYCQLAASYGSSYPEDTASIHYCFLARSIWDKIYPLNFYSVMNQFNIAANYWDLTGTIDTLKGIKNRKALKAAMVAKADSAFNNTLMYSRKALNKTFTIMTLDSLASVQAYEGKYKNALQNIRSLEKLKDSIYSQKDKNKISDIESDREIALRNKQLEINKLQIANEHKQTIFLTVGLILLLLIASLIFSQSRQRKKANTSLSALNSQLTTANVQLDKANKIKIKFLGILNHDLRGPVAGYLNFIRLQRDDPDMLAPHAAERFAARSEKVAENLLEKMEDLLLWSKDQMENFTPQPAHVAVKELFEYIARSMVTATGINVNFSQPDGMQLLTDENYLKTIMHNLTGNAQKALKNTPNAAIEWKAWEKDGITYFSVTDNGPGATQQQFAPLYNKEAPIGIKSGLGLHIVRDMAHAINCKVTAVTNPGQGVSIMLEFENMAR
nr:tetratricopeptide repeat-containing sensor histidine kinase [Mucilaginibacter sp. X5P1]MBB6140568.1 signal transduction histidine kinase [Mucilaginibacter sp. X5P1]